MEFTDDELDLIEEALVEYRKGLERFSFSAAITMAAIKALISRIEHEKITRRVKREMGGRAMKDPYKHR